MPDGINSAGAMTFAKQNDRAGFWERARAAAVSGLNIVGSVIGDGAVTLYECQDCLSLLADSCWPESLNLFLFLSFVLVTSKALVMYGPSED